MCLALALSHSLAHNDSVLPGSLNLVVTILISVSFVSVVASVVVELGIAVVVVLSLIIVFVSVVVVLCATVILVASVEQPLVLVHEQGTLLGV